VSSVKVAQVWIIKDCGSAYLFQFDRHSLTELGVRINAYAADPDMDFDAGDAEEAFNAVDRIISRGQLECSRYS